ncbi:MAG: YhfC family intramembrane metalloprotease [Lachnospiraceae bacterium]|nr:YhfC family intramembrane metalloprotease [Lachnospiraceae bacterium]
MTLNSMFYTCVVCFILPVLMAMALPKDKALTNKKGGVVSMFVLGAAVYFLSEILCRRMIFINFINDTDWYYFLQQEPLKYSLFYCSTAAFVEEIARLVIFLFFYRRFTGKYMDKMSAVRYGLGAAWVEAIAIIGLTVLKFLIATTADTRILDEIASLKTTMAGTERIIGFFTQVSYALIIVAGIRFRKKTICTIFAFLLHAGAATLDMWLGLLSWRYRDLLYVNAGIALVLCLLALGLWNLFERKAKQDVSKHSSGNANVEGKNAS